MIGIHPGTIETALTRKYANNKFTATADEAVEQMLNVCDKLSSENTGGFFDYHGKAIEF